MKIVGALIDDKGRCWKEWAIELYRGPATLVVQKLIEHAD